jgi:uncharacterized membrane protein
MIGIILAICFGVIFVGIYLLAKKLFIEKIEAGIKQHLNSLYKYSFTEEKFTISKWAYIYVGVVGSYFTLFFGFLVYLLQDPNLVAQGQLIIQIIFGTLCFISLAITLLFLLVAFPKAFIDVTKEKLVYFNGLKTKFEIELHQVTFVGIHICNRKYGESKFHLTIKDYEDNKYEIPLLYRNISRLIAIVFNYKGYGSNDYLHHL